ncbi:hypothetical protein JYU15_00825 [bacterium AH-315-I18]|nr:hypothetical protein [Phycisphaeraceae bacterium]MBN4060957.1 hypothetical protein [bacterium AH-315-I18]
MANQTRYNDAELALETLKYELEKHLRKVPCPVHGEHSKRVTVYGSSAYDMRFKVDGCCDDLADAMLESIGQSKSVV